MDETEQSGPPPEIALLGDPSLRAGERRISLSVLDKPLALLVYLSMEQTRHSRSDLVALLWPGMERSAAFTNLSRTLYLLDERLAPLSLVGRNRSHLWWNAPSDPSGRDPVDARRLLSDRPPDGCARLHEPSLCEACRIDIEEKRLLVRGEFLEGVRLPSAPPFRRWVGEIREKISGRKEAFDLLLSGQKNGTDAILLPYVPISGNQRWERRQIALLCALTEAPDLDPTEILDRLRKWREKAESFVRDRDGWIAPFPGTGLLAFFGFPHAKEEALRQAAHAAREIRSAFLDLPALSGLSIRIALHAGEGVVDISRNIPDATGKRTWEASGCAREASPGTIVATAAALPLLSRHFRMEPQGSLPFSSDPSLSLHRLGEEKREILWNRLLLGRERELEELRDLWKSAMRGQRITVWITGPPGIGKSSLVAGFFREAAAFSPLPVLRKYECLPEHRERPFGPVIRFLRRLLDLPDRIGEGELRYRAERTLASMERPVSEELPLLLHILEGKGPWSTALAGLSPELLLSRIESFLLALLSRTLRGSPLLMAVEDLPWADHATIELLGKAHSHLSGDPALILLTSRTEKALAGLSLPPPDRILPVGPLSRLSSRKLVRALSPSPLSPEETGQVLDLAEGVPLFLAELVPALKDGNPAGLLPTTLQNLLDFRIGAMGEAKGLAQGAACLGQIFSEDQLLSLAKRMKIVPSGSPELLRPTIDELIEREILDEVRSGSERIFNFRHILLQEALLRSLSAPDRRRIHGCIAALLQEEVSPSGTVRPEVLADHLFRAGNSDAAIGMWMEAGERSAAMGAYPDAYVSLGKALEAARSGSPEPDAEREMEILMAMGPVALVVHGHGSAIVEEIYARARELSGPLEASPRTLPVLFGLWASVVTRTGPTASLPLLESLLKETPKLGGKWDRLRADYALGNTRFWQGDLAASEAALSNALSEPGEAPGISLAPYAEDRWVSVAAFMNFVLVLRGLFAEGQKWGERGLARARELDHSNSLGFIMAFRTCATLFMEEPERTSASARELLDLSERCGYLILKLLAMLALSWAEGTEEAAFRARSIVGNIGPVLSGMLPLFTMVEAGTMLRAGLAEEAIASARRGLGEADRTGTVVFDPELLRLEGEALLLQSSQNLEKSGHLFREAAERARKTGAVWFETKALRSLARRGSEETRTFPS